MARIWLLLSVSSVFSACVSWEAPDIDGDGVLASEGDCNDLDASAAPGMEEIWYDGVDQDCDGNDADKDGDGFDSWQVGGTDCWDDPDNPPAGFAVISSEWTQPSAADVHPDATEVYYDGVDANCDEADDFDQDGDGYRSSKHEDANGELGDDCIDGSTLDDVNDAGLDPADVNPGVTDDTCYDGTNADCDTDEADPLNDSPDYNSDFDCDGDGWMQEEECDDADGTIEPNDDPDPFGDCIDANCDGNDGDEDGDGYVTDDYAANCPGWSELSGHLGAGDCWDSGSATSDFIPINNFSATNAAAVNPAPSTQEVYYDGMDQNCDGKSDFDADEDGYDSSTYANRSGLKGDDCNDDNPSVRPGVLEECTTSYDDNCDGDTNDLNATTCITYWQDFDADGYGDEGSQLRCYCEPKINVSANEYYRATNDNDCNDNNYWINPGVAEICDSANTDEDCDGGADDADPDGTPSSGTTNYYSDNDSDGYGAGSATAYCDNPGNGDVTDNTDCNDNSASSYPGATETCDGDDNDCDGSTDENDAVDALTWYLDGDSDSYGKASSSTKSCSQPSGYVSDNTDCDDSDANTNPGADEYCDGHDDDCDGSTDEASAVDASNWYRDADSDGYGNSSNKKTQCYQPSGYVSDQTDCDDSNGSINPSGTEVCDASNKDEDCDGGADDSDPNGTPSSGTTNYYSDGDSDGYGAGSATAYCDDPGNGDVTDNTDCNDSNGSINPGATEVCDSSNTDEDCDGGADDNDPEGASGGSLYYADSDSDGYGDESDSGTSACDSAPSGTVSDNTDCNDANASINPAGSETNCDGIDSDCDGSDSEYGITDLSAGDLIITEIMSNPSAVLDKNGEWFEIYNAGSLSVDLDGLDLESSGSSDTGNTVGSCLNIDPGEYLIFAHNADSSTNGGITADYIYSRSTLKLANSTDSLTLVSGSTTIDEVSWDDGATYPDPNGASLALHPENTDSDDNDIGTLWCEGSSTYGDGDLATPGAENDSCGESIDTTVQSILNSNCTSCHSGSSPSKSLDLASGAAWDAMYLVSSTQDGSYNLVEPDDSSNSWLVKKIEGTQGSGNGNKMPPSGSGLSSSEIQSIKDWINDGAWK